MTNQTIELMGRHASVRKFKPEGVPPEAVETIVAAAQRASTAANFQVVSVVAVTEPERRATLSKICGQEHVAQAPVVLIWCADLRRLDRACQLRGYVQETRYVENLVTCAVDVGIAAQNAALAAESLGLGICYLGSIRNNAPATIDLLQLPPLVFPLVGMAIGWPGAAPVVRPRLPLSAILYREVYDGAYRDAELREYDQMMIATGIYEGRQVPVPGRPGQTEAYGWLEHCARRVSQPVRVELSEALRKQGFGLQ